MQELDMRLKLLAGVPWEIEGVGTVYPPTMKEIISIGYTTYLSYVNLLTLDPRDIISDKDIVDQLVGFDIIFANSSDKELIDRLIDAIRFFFKEKYVLFSKSHAALFLGDLSGDKLRYINRDNYNRVKDIIGLVSCTKEVDETGFNPAGEKARQIVEKLKRRKEILKRQKGQKNTDNDIQIDIFDIVSAISAKTGGVYSVMECTFFQLMDMYKRLERINQYEITTTAMMHGGDKLELKHWASRIVDD